MNEMRRALDRVLFWRWFGLANILRFFLVRFQRTRHVGVPATVFTPGQGVSLPDSPEAIADAALWLGLNRLRKTGAHRDVASPDRLAMLEQEYCSELADVATFEEANAIVRNGTAGVQESASFWDPYATATRSLTLIAWCMAHRCEPSAEMSAALHAALRPLSLRLERHLRGNHLLRETAALCALAKLTGTRARRIQRLERLLCKVVLENFLPDGGHRERSTFYHMLSTQDLALVLHLMRPGSEAAPVVRQTMKAAREHSLRHRLETWPTVMGDTPPNHLAEPTAESSQDADGLSPSFGLASRSVNGVTVWMRVGKSFSMRCPGHGRDDGLSIAIADGTRPILGSQRPTTYAPGSLRNKERSAAAHSTVRFAADVPDFWGSFRHRIRWQAERSVTADDGLHAHLRSPSGQLTRMAELNGRAIEIRDLIEPVHSGAVVEWTWIVYQENSSALLKEGSDEIVFESVSLRWDNENLLDCAFSIGETERGAIEVRVKALCDRPSAVKWSFTLTS